MYILSPIRYKHIEYTIPNFIILILLLNFSHETQPRLGNLQETIQKMCKFKSSGFPGSQPVSMDMNNLRLLSEKPYRVSWKADGTRYMMLILKENEVYFFDRDNACFQVSGIRFPCRDDIHTHIQETLIDGEMVIDKVNGLSIPRYLVYDIVCYNGASYMDNEFFSDQKEVYCRLKCIKEFIVGKVINTNIYCMNIVRK